MYLRVKKSNNKKNIDYIISDTAALYIFYSAISFFVATFVEEKFGLPSGMALFLQILILGYILIKCFICSKILFLRGKYTYFIPAFVCLFMIMSCFNIQTFSIILTQNLFYETIFQGCLIYILFYHICDVEVFIKRLNFYAKGVWSLGIILLLITNVSVHYMAYGYRMLLAVIVLLYCGCMYKRYTDIIMAFIGILAIFIGGSRAACLIAVIAIPIYLLIFSTKKRAYLLALTIGIIGIILYLFRDQIITIIANIVYKYGIYSRTLNKIFANTIMSESARIDNIRYGISLLKVSVNRLFLGYGMAGERYFFRRDLVHIVDGYPHNIIIEIYVQYGIILGTVIMVGILYCIFCSLSKKKTADERLFSLILVTFNFQLLISSSYLQSEYFFAMIGWSVQCIEKLKKTQFISLNSKE